MITFRVSEVEDGEALLVLIDRLAETHGVRVGYMQPCLPRTFQVRVEGRYERRFESDFMAFAARAGWHVGA